MKKYLIVILIAVAAGHLHAQPDVIETDNGKITIHPVMHGALAIEWQDITIYVDPYGGGELFSSLPGPDLILITDIHGDHLDKETLQEINTENAVFIVPQAVEGQMEGINAKAINILSNGEETTLEELKIMAVPMYNLPETEDSRHPKGRGNGYVVTIDEKRIYISGDTEDIPEMRQLENIDIAFICMNLPYTMDIDQAADAVLDFKPAIVYPYHFRGQGGFSDVAKFEEMVENENDQIEVRLRDWYNNE